MIQEFTKDKLKKERYFLPMIEKVVEVFFLNNHVWLSQRQIAALYNVQILTVRKHLRNAYKKERLIESEVSFLMKASKEDKGNPKRVYNLKAIDNIGHRINSSYVTKFHEWLKERQAKQAKKQEQ